MVRSYWKNFTQREDEESEREDLKRGWIRTLGMKIQESLSSVLPITAVVLLLCVTVAPLEPGTMVMFLFGALLLVLGMGLFTLGVDLSMMPMGEGIGIEMSKSRRIGLPLTVCFVLGALITIAEPDLQLLAQQVPSIPNRVLILSVAAGVGLFLAVSFLHTVFSVKLSHALLFFYALTFLLAFLTPKEFIPMSFDSGGVTTGPITVPFIMAMGIGMASLRSDKHSQADSFGLIALCSIGSVLAVLLLGVFYSPEEAATSTVRVAQVSSTREAAMQFIWALPHYAREVALAVLPIAGVFLVFQLISRRFRAGQLRRICVGLAYTYAGLVMFLTGVNEGFLSAGYLLGKSIAGGRYPFLLIPIGMVIGYFIVAAEPAVHVLNKQVEELTSGNITAREMQLGLSAGVALSVGLAMIRILTGVSILWLLIPGYALALALTFFVSDVFTGVAFDSGGVASGPMTAAFLSPLAMGACEAVGGNMLTDAFGIVAMVAMTPLVTIQLLGLRDRLKRRGTRPQPDHAAQTDFVVYYDGEVGS